MIVHANRASAIIYNLLRSYPLRRPFLLPANVCPVVPMVFQKAGVAFEFIDITEKDYCVDREIVLDRIRSHRYGGLLLVRTYGYYQSLDGYFADLRNLDEDLLLIDDRCLCEPAFESPNGGADVVLYSTGPKKFVDLGYGGFACIDERIPHRHRPLGYSAPATARLEQEYKHCIDRRTRFVYVDDDWLDNRIPGFSLVDYRDAVAAGIESARSTRSTINAWYRSVLPPEIMLGDAWNNWRFCIRVKNKAELLKSIFSSGLFASSHYASLAGIFGPGEAPVARKLHDGIVNLFNDRHISMSQVEKLTALILQHLRNDRRTG